MSNPDIFLLEAGRVFKGKELYLHIFISIYNGNLMNRQWIIFVFVGYITLFKLQSFRYGVNLG